MGATEMSTERAITISVRRVAIVLFGASIALAIANYAMQLATRAAGTDTIAALDVGDEVSLATWFQTLLFIGCAVVLLMGAHHAHDREGHQRGWLFLALVMVALSIDEAVSLHERAGSALRELLDTGGVLYYVWVVPALIFVAIVALLEIGWLRALPARIRNLVIIAGAVFVLGAAGLELVAGANVEAEGSETLRYITLTAIEELAEMLGLSLFVTAILSHLTGRQIHLEVSRP